MKNQEQVFIVFSEASNPDPVPGEKVIIDEIERTVIKVNRMSRCMCGKCGLQNNLGIVAKTLG